MERDIAVARIAFALVKPPVSDQLSLIDFGDSLRSTLESGARTIVERYNRVWRLGRVSVDQRNQRIRGKIGYESVGRGAELWNPELEDFEEVSVLQGHTSPFVLDYSTMRVVFQLRTPVIRPRTFTGAFQALINKSSAVHVWKVLEEVEEVSWDTWRHSVERVTRLRVSIERPNPHYGDRKQLERIVEGSRSEMMKAILKASDDELEGLNVEDDFIAESIRHVQAGYGNFTADGEPRGVEAGYSTSWSSAQGGTPLQRTVEIDPGEAELSHNALDDALDELGISLDPEERVRPLGATAAEEGRAELNRAIDAREEDDMLELESGEHEEP